MKIVTGIIVLVVVLLIASFAFSGRRSNPPVEASVNWDRPATEAMFRRACADCHSNETHWPWYSYFAPISWDVIEHVEEGRKEFNISSEDMGHADESAELVEDGDMPLEEYLRGHPEARLTESEKAEFVEGLKRTFGERR